MDKDQMKKNPEIVVIYGGVGSERDVSLVTGKAVLDALLQASGSIVRGIELKERALPEGLNGDNEVVFLALHGEFGEDGQIQQLLEDAGIEYGGCDSHASALCMNKYETKRRWEVEGLPVVPGTFLEGIQFHSYQAGALVSKYGDELIVKPISSGSSVGLQLLSGVDAVHPFLMNPEHGKQDWVLESRIRGREFSVGVLEGRAMAIVEIIVPKGRVYDYEQKYHRDDTVYECPAALGADETEWVQQLAERAYQACGCRDFARVDFLYDSDKKEWYCLEINTLPGMTPSSLLPKSAGGVGIKFSELIGKMIEPAMDRLRD